jgi:membrane protease YdiL (CAAX protease family)
MSDDYEWRPEEEGDLALTPQYGWGEPPELPRPKDTPNFGHTLLFFVLALPLALVGQVLSLLLARGLHVFGNASLSALNRHMADDARMAIASQTVIYLLILIVTVLLFPLIWHRPFLEGIHYQPSVAQRWVILLLVLGLALGFGISLAGNYLPMPKNPPILLDMDTTTGAWMMLIFGITMAPLLEELAFRGFLLGSLINACAWLARHTSLSPAVLNMVGIPLSIVLTSLPFALLHSAQVGHAWGPVLLIGVVSVVLCVVRLVSGSVAASTVVHATYNLTLFLGMLIQTDGFRHLEKLKS